MYVDYAARKLDNFFGWEYNMQYEINGRKKKWPAEHKNKNKTKKKLASSTLITLPECHRPIDPKCNVTNRITNTTGVYLMLSPNHSPMVNLRPLASPITGFLNTSPHSKGKLHRLKVHKTGASQHEFTFVIHQTLVIGKIGPLTDGKQ